MISSDLPESCGMSDRILVMRQGRIVGELARAEATQERVMQLAVGGAATAARRFGQRRRRPPRSMQL